MQRRSENNNQRNVTPKSFKGKQPLPYATHRLLVMRIAIQLPSNGAYKTSLRNNQRGIHVLLKVSYGEQQFLYDKHCFNLIYIVVKFHQDNLNRQLVDG